jgi:hypothetical protein
MLPVSSRMGLGAWQATCSSVGSLMKWRTTFQNSVPFVSPCLKSNAPGPERAQRAPSVRGLVGLPSEPPRPVLHRVHHEVMQDAMRVRHWVKS